jgi:hypothetical protein
MAIASRLISRLQQRTQELKAQKRTLQSETDVLQYETEVLQSETELLQSEKQALQRETEKLRKTNSNLQSLLSEIESRQSKIPPKEVYTLRSLLSSSNQSSKANRYSTPHHLTFFGDGFTQLTAQAPHNFEARVVDIGGCNPVNIRYHAVDLAAKHPEVKAQLIDNAKDPNVLEVVELGKVAEFKAGKLEFHDDRIHIWHMRSGKASFEPAQLLENLNALQVTIDRNKPNGAYWHSRISPSPWAPRIIVNSAALEDAFKERVFELSEFDEHAILSKRSQIVDEVNLSKQAETKRQTVTETVRHSDVRGADRISADDMVIETVHTTER